MLLLTLLLLPLRAQQKKGDADVLVDITVVDENGDPLVGASVKDAAKSVGVVSDMDGKASLWVPRGSTITVSYLGMQPRTVKVTKPLGGDFVLHEDGRMLDQVVVNGYTQTDVRKSTGSVGFLSGKDLNTSPIQNVDMLLQGKIAGVNVQAVSGRPGESAKIRIRGISSITGSSEPLWVVDGVPLQKNVPENGTSYIRSGDLSTLYANGVAGINPQDIESINVLKDASAAAIYGSQAQAGVIVITTKRGKAGKTRVNYNGSLSIQSKPVRDANLMNSREKLAYEQSIWDEFSADGFASGGYYPVIGVVGQIRSGYGRFAGWTTEQQDAYIAELGQHSTDWFQELFRTTTSQSHNISVSGGSDKQTFYFSGGMTTNNGIVKRTNSDSFNFSAKINGTPTENLMYSAQVDFSYLKALSPSSTINMFNYAYFANPYERPYNDDGSYRADDTFFSLANANGDVYSRLPSNGVNIIRELDHTTQRTRSNTTTLRGDMTWRPFKGFRLYGLASATFGNDNSMTVIQPDTYTAWTDRPFEGTNSSTSTRTYGSMTQGDTRNQSWLTRLQANYSTDIATLHHVSALAGTEIRYSRATSNVGKMYGWDSVTGNHVTPSYRTVSADGRLTESEQVNYSNIVDALNQYTKTENAFASFYGALDYVYNNKYVVNATIRSDGNNNFGSKEQFNLIWSTGLAWNIDEEKFFKALNPVLTRATVRVSTGLTGGVNKSVYPQIIMTYYNFYRIYDGVSYRVGDVYNAPNPRLRWEHTRDYNASLDLGFLHDRITLYLSGYRRKGYDLVTEVPVVSPTGFDYQSYNTSEQINEGFEVTINATPVRTDKITWGLSGNIAYNKNYVSKYKKHNQNDYQSVTLDYPQGAIFSGKSTGINPETGIYNYKMRSDAVTSSASDYRNFRNYYFYIGTSNAPWTGGLSTHVSYGNLSLSVSSSFSLGNKISNKIESPVHYYNTPGSTVNYLPIDDYDVYTAHLNKPKEAARRWTANNPITDGYPRLIDAKGQRLNLFNDQTIDSGIANAVYYESGSYFKLGSMTLSYNLPEKLVRHWGLTGVGVNFTANNLFIITGYSGLNPETPGAVYPMSKSYSFGINFGI